MEETGPIYGVPLIDNLPLGRGMRQAMPSRNDLISIRDAPNGERVCAGYEVLLQHYHALRVQLSTLEVECGKCKTTDEILDELSGNSGQLPDPQST